MIGIAEENALSEKLKKFQARFEGSAIPPKTRELIAWLESQLELKVNALDLSEVEETITRHDLMNDATVIESWTDVTRRN